MKYKLITNFMPKFLKTFKQVHGPWNRSISFQFITTSDFSGQIKAMGGWSLVECLRGCHGLAEGGWNLVRSRLKTLGFSFYFFFERFVPFRLTMGGVYGMGKVWLKGFWLRRTMAALITVILSWMALSFSKTPFFCHVGGFQGWRPLL